ncbi:MAG: tetratricopeptide repeat protein [Planctomycetota bacterium]
MGIQSRFVLWLTGAAFTAAMFSCESPGPRGEGVGGAAPRDATSQPVRLTEVPPPPGVAAAAVTPLTGEALVQAQWTLDQVVAAQPVPEALRPPRIDTANDQASAAIPLAAEKFYAAGRQALRQGDNFRAVQQYEKALRLAPDRSAILRGLAHAWTRSGNRVSATNYYRRAYIIDPTDLESLFMLGRTAVDERDWSRAIALLNQAKRLTEGSAVTDPVAEQLIGFYLANALAEAGYAAAAIEGTRDFLEGNAAARRAASPYGRELAAVSSQHGQTLMRLGDLYHRLDDPSRARESYAAAAEFGVLNGEALHRRRLYTLLRLGQTRSAGDLLISGIEESGASPGALALIPYAVNHGIDAQELIRKLQAMDHAQGSTPLRLALADVLPRDEAADLLAAHLETRPGDDAVFGRLLTLLLADPQDRAAVRRAITLTANGMAGSPELAELYADRLLAETPEPGVLLAAFPPEASADENPAWSAMLATLRGKLLQADGQKDSAVEAFRRAAELSPEQDLARIELAAVYLERGDLGQAEDVLGDRLADSIHPRVVLLRARALKEAGREGEALVLLEGALRRSPPGGPLMLEKARLLVDLGRVAEAETTLLDALNARPTDEAIYEALLDIYNRGNMQENYRRLLRRMFDTIPQAQVTLRERAIVLVSFNRFAEAREVLARVDPETTDPVKYDRLRLAIHAGLNEAEAVHEVLEPYLDPAQDASDDAVLLIGERFYRRTVDLERWARVVVVRWAAKPASFQRGLTLGRAYFVLKEFGSAAASIRSALSQEHRESMAVDFQVSQLLTQAYFQATPDALGEAEAQVVAVAEEHPRLGPYLYQQMATLYEERGDRSAAWRVLERAVAQYPRNASLNNSLGYSLANAGVRLAEAEQLIRRAVEEEPEAAAYLDSLGWVFYKRGQFEEALEWLGKSRNAEGGMHPVIIDHQGDAFYRLGRPEQAMKAWREAQQMISSPNYRSSGDPEEEGLPARLEDKIEALARGDNPAVAELGQGVTLDADPRRDAGGGEALEIETE